MTEFAIRGVVGCLLTPFDAHGEFEAPLLQAEVAYLDRAGLDAFCVGGMAGETAGSTPEEYGRICAVAVQATDKPVLAALCPDSTREVLELARAAVNAGVAGLLLSQPHYLFQPGPQGLDELFRTLRCAVDIPLLLSNSLTANPLDLASVRRLTDGGWIDGVHQGASDAHLLADLLATAPRLPILSGVEPLMYLALLLGAEGIVTSLAAVFPEDCVALYSAVRIGDHARARLIHERLVRLWRVLDHPIEFLARLKFASAALGRPVDVPRSPYNWLPPESAAELRRALAADAEL